MKRLAGLFCGLVALGLMLALWVWLRPAPPTPSDLAPIIGMVDRIVVDEMLERMEDAEGEPLDTDEPDPFYIAPHSKLPLEWAYRRTKQHELQAELDGASIRVLDLLSRFRGDLEYLMKRAGLSVPGELPPGGAPMPPPVDPMMAGGAPMPPGDPMMGGMPPPPMPV
jgi:hypothetical protein